MREIKFRAWQEKTKRMIDWRTLFCEYTAHSIFMVPEEFSLTVMQFTGLKDKSGKEIYEGDILKYFLSDSHGSMSGDQFVLGDVFFDGGSFMARKLGGIRFDACEIIGNIYESPSMLKSRTEPKL